MNALIRYHLRIDPRQLPDEEYAEVWAGLEWVMKAKANTTE
jgi:hypothetical protein